MVGRNCCGKKLLETDFFYSFELLEIWLIDMLSYEISVMPLDMHKQKLNTKMSIFLSFWLEVNWLE
jgi:hypothetical protein